jgi:hypothetical protein
MSIVQKFGFKQNQLGKPLTFAEIHKNHNIFWNFNAVAYGVIIVSSLLFAIAISLNYYVLGVTVMGMSPLVLIGTISLFPAPVRVGAERSAKMIGMLDSLTIKEYASKHKDIRLHLSEIKQQGRPVYWSDLLFIKQQGKMLDERLKLEEAEAYFAELRMN